MGQLPRIATSLTREVGDNVLLGVPTPFTVVAHSFRCHWNYGRELSFLG
jgi:hypothetical protein